MARKAGLFPHMGHEKEPPQPHGPRPKGHPPFHSHSSRPKRHIKGGAGKEHGGKR